VPSRDRCAHEDLDDADEIRSAADAKKGVHPKKRGGARRFLRCEFVGAEADEKQNQAPTEHAAAYVLDAPCQDFADHRNHLKVCVART